MRLLLAANNQATRRNEIIKSYLQLGSSSNRYAPRLPQQETKSSTKQLPPTDPILGPENLLKTGFAQKDLPSCPSGRHTPQSFIETKSLRFCNLDTVQQPSKKTGFAQKDLPSCPSGRHTPQSFIETKSLRFCNHWYCTTNFVQQTSKNEPKHGPKNGTAWRSHFWDRMHRLVKKQKKSTFTVSFLGPSGGTKNETAKSQN